MYLNPCITRHEWHIENWTAWLCLYHDQNQMFDVIRFSFLHVCLAVDGLEKSSSLASCDVVVDRATNTQNAPTSRQQRGKLSSIGQLFKPWKWRKKKSSDKFQDLSKGRVSVCLFESVHKTFWRSCLDLCSTLSVNRSSCSQKACKRKMCLVALT